ncbi:MAG: BrnA antitoxin family protein [Bifidobacteriaceae bacterium]|jgi:hypothetical protein|nr:BrnA antitoxin family protein [Bifidobacteriaceae bacterium]
MSTKNITLSLPADLVRQAKVLAAQRDTSVSGLVAELLGQAVGDPTDFAEEWAAEERRMAAGIGLRVGKITWTREEAHRR